MFLVKKQQHMQSNISCLLVRYVALAAANIPADIRILLFLNCIFVFGEMLYIIIFIISLIYFVPTGGEKATLGVVGETVAKSLPAFWDAGVAMNTIQLYK